MEGKILDDVCQLFIASNGLYDLVETPIRQGPVAACCFAMLLFQCTKEQEQPMVLETDEELNAFMSSFGCGFEFDKQVSEVFANSSTHARFLLLSKYALVEPNPASKTERGKAIDNPFMMRPAQQLIALRLLGINLSALVSSNPFGFEVLSTHTMKTALAASSAVAWERRNSVKETLEVVGCKIVEGGGTHVDAKAEFEELKNYFVIRDSNDAPPL
ncbi:expressed unknown protein [Seminavis robusta]|uniref:Uncharacterized protein n=1 Tax=Seminavis robusta TaxID=568900 RepID=A0A9N8ECV7_9STRA|nr:expressed unknown protein [Seminavis robusta]|eukprot:Sro905_g218490.1 n/a (216) ;mRNA; f:9269-9981